MKRAVYSLIPLLLLATAGFAQTHTITGFIADTAGMPIPHATVALMVGDSVANGTISNDEGHFALSATPGLYTLLISRMGYELWRRDMELEGSLALERVTLHEGTVAIEEVAVSAYKEGAMPTAGGLIYTVSERDVKSSTNSYHLLSKIPELSVSRTDRTVGVVGSSRTLILVNGVRRESIFINTLRPSDIVRVEVVSNPSIRYLSEDITSVVNIITRRKVRGGSGEVSQMVTVPNVRLDGWTDLSITGNTDRMSLYVVGFFNYANERRTKKRDITRSTLPSADVITFESDTDTCYERDFPGFEVSGGGDFQLGRRTALTVEGFYSSNSMYENSITHRRMLYNDAALRRDRLEYSDAEKERRQKYSAYLQHMQADSCGQLDAEFSYGDYFYGNDAQNRIASAGSVRDYALRSASHQRSFHALGEYSHQLWGGNLAAGYRMRHQRVGQIADDAGEGASESAKYIEWKHYPYVRYDGRVRRKFFYRLGIGAEFTAYRLAPTGHAPVRNRYVKPLPSVSLQYTTARAGAFGISYSASLNRIPIQYLNPAVISLDTLSIRQGNPKLEPYLSHSAVLRYTLSSGGLYLAPRVSYVWAKNSVVSVGEVQANGSYRYTYVPAAFYSSLTPSVYLKWSINDMWEVSAAARYHLYNYRDATNGINRRLGSFSWGAEAACYVSDFTIAAGAAYDGKGLTGNHVNELPYDGFVRVDWEFWKGWWLTAELRYLVPWKISGTTESLNYYSHTVVTRRDRYLRPTITLAYSFEYGYNREKTSKRIESSEALEKLSL